MRVRELNFTMWGWDISSCLKYLIDQTESIEKLQQKESSWIGTLADLSGKGCVVEDSVQVLPPDPEFFASLTAEHT